MLDRQGRVRLLVPLMIEAEMRCKLGTDSGVISHQLFYQSIEIGTDFSRFFVLFNVLQCLTGEPNVHCPVHRQHVTQRRVIGPTVQEGRGPQMSRIRADKSYYCQVQNLGLFRFGRDLS